MLPKIDFFSYSSDTQTKDRISAMQFVLVITCLRGQFGKNCPSVFLKILNLPE